MDCGVLMMVARIPNWPEADEVIVDLEAKTAVLIYHDDKREAINNARYAAANNQEFLLDLVRESRRDDSTEVKKQRWATWLRTGLIPAPRIN
jgi:hypothetical protein